MTTTTDKQNFGTVLNIERSSVHDGVGFRTVVFLKGCPLRCQWCSTPESQSPAIQKVGEKTYGKVMSVADLMKELRKDSIFYFHSGGGLTLSGGEPLVQADFCQNFLQQARQEGINTAMETCLAVPFSQVEKVLPHLDTVYADLKHIDPEKHKFYVGMDNGTILDNIRRIDEGAGGECTLIIRYPLVPGVNDDEKTLHATGAFLANLKNLDSVQLLPYHRLGVESYRRLGLEYQLESVRAPDDAHMEACRRVIGNYVGGAC